MEVENLTQLRCKVLAHKQVRDLQRAARHLVFVRRADATTGCANRARTAGFFTGDIQRHVRRQYERTSRADMQAFVNRHATGDQGVRFFDQRVERQHNTITDQALHAVAQDAGRNEM